MKGLRILVVDDEEAILEATRTILEKEGYEVETAATAHEGLDLLQAHVFHLVLSDLRLPDLDGLDLLRLIKQQYPTIEVVLLTGYGTIDVAVQAMREGAYDFVQKPVKRMVILRTVEKACEKQALVAENRLLREELSAVRAPKEVIASSAAMRRTLETAEQVASSSATILITGESGTGKEVVVNTIHQASNRKDRPLIKVSCAAIPETLLEAELFGHERGAFTGAVALRKGRFELADKGTLFLDEIGDMSLPTQVKLLRVLQEGEFERLGGTRTLHVDVRLIAATNIDMEEAVEARRFRRDLYYRLNVINLQIPPLRERQEDIPALANYALRRFSALNGRRIDSISPQAMERMTAYPWPGNVRELENVMERAVILSRDAVIDLDDLPGPFGSVEPNRTEVRIPIGTTLARAEEILIRETLRHAEGNKLLAARILGVAARTIYRKADKGRE